MTKIHTYDRRLAARTLMLSRFDRVIVFLLSITSSIGQSYLLHSPYLRQCRAQSFWARHCSEYHCSDRFHRIVEIDRTWRTTYRILVKELLEA